MAAPPEKIGPYQVEGRLGAGGMGEVYRARDERLDRDIALKRVKPDASDPERARRLFRREARSAARLNHFAIVQIHDLVEEESGDWLVMELVEGRSLRQELAGGPLDPSRVVEIGAAVAAGLAAAHEVGLIHRDLKLENVMVTPAGEVKVLDFGIAKQLPRKEDVPLTTLSEGEKIFGTYTAMSPEQAAGDAIDHRSDLFSLGSMLYELLTEASPFAADSRLETLKKICFHREIPVREHRPDVPKELADLVGKLLEKEKERRPQDAKTVLAALEKLSSTSESPQTETFSDIEALPTADEGLDPLVRPTTAEDSRQPAAWRTTASRAGLVAAVVALALVLWLVRFRKPPEPPSDVDGGPRLEALDNHALFEHGMELVKYEYRDGNVDRAIEAFSLLIERDPDSGPAHAGLARAYWRKYLGASKDKIWLDRALPAAERAVELDPFLQPARISRALVYAEAGRADEATADLEEVRRLSPEDPEALYGLAHVAKIRGDLQTTEELYTRALAQRPDDWELHLLLGVVYYRMARYPEAESAFLRSIELAPDNIVAYRNLSAVYYQLDAIPKAATALQQALEIRPMGTLYNNLGILYFAQGLYARAAAAFEKAIAMPGGANHHLHWGNLGDAYRWSPGQEEEAKKAFLRAAQLLKEKLATNPENVTSKSRLAVYYAKLGAREAALVEAAAIDEAAAGPSVLFRLALTHEICGGRDQALTVLARALDAGYSLQDVKSDPELLQLREDPRYHQLAASFENDVDS